MATILVVDDDPDTNRLLRTLLRRYGFDSAGAPDGEQALELVKHVKPDLVILDQMMPGIDGLEVLRTLRSMPQYARLPVVIYSAIADPPFALQARRSGASEVWLKGSIDTTEIPSRLKALLNTPAHPKPEVALA